MKIACIGNYIPRECGIATFTHHFIHSLLDNFEGPHEENGYVVAITDYDQKYNYPEIVSHEIRQDHQRDYFKAAKYINFSEANICFLQHEFAIFGGESGVYILPLIHRLKIPLIVIFHTVLRHPSYNEKMIIQEIGKKADKLVVMSKRAIDFLTVIYNIPKEKIEFIEHGVPEFDFVPNEFYKKRFKLEDKKSIFSFGLINRNKGYETVIYALPRVVEKHPETVYIILGKTHPNILKVSGDEYRNYLRRLVKNYNLENHVYFNNRFVTTDELLSYLAAVDICITPYLNEAQITSGTLSYAVGAGTAVLSTPYWHAEELLADGRGRLFDFNDSDGLADIIIDLLDNSSELFRLRENAYNYGRKMTWPQIGKKHFHLSNEVLKTSPKIIAEPETIINPALLPKFSLEHMIRLTDNTGILQHSKFSVPNLKEGYCLDDNARALLVTLMSYRQKKDPGALKLIPIYLSFIHYMQNKNGTFRNFLNFKREYLDKIGSEDAFGRTIWALGYLIRYSPNEAYFELGKEMFDKAYPHFEKLKSLRGIANTIIGICHYFHRFSGDETLHKTLEIISGRLVNKYERTKSAEWKWFELILTYDNGILPLSLFVASEFIGRESIIETAKESMAFLDNIVFEEGYLRPIGSDTWYRKGQTKAQYAQQSINAAALVRMYFQAYQVTKNKNYIKKMNDSFMWFLGENDLRIPLYDFETNGCSDGLEKDGVNRNQGAESILSYLMAHLFVLTAHEYIL